MTTTQSSGSFYCMNNGECEKQGREQCDYCAWKENRKDKEEVLKCLSQQQAPNYLMTI